MQSKTSTQKSAKGSVVIFTSHNRLQLRFRFGGKRRYLSLGLTDTPINRKFAELKAAEIEQDIGSLVLEVISLFYLNKQANSFSRKESKVLKP